MEPKEEGLEDGGKRAGLDGCIVLAFASILGLDFGQRDLSERGGISVVSWHLLVLMVAVCWHVYGGISIVCTLRLSGWHLKFTLLGGVTKKCIVLKGKHGLDGVCCGCRQPGRMVLSLGVQILPRRQHHIGGWIAH